MPKPKADRKLKTYQRGFTKTVHGFAEVQASSEEEALEKFEDGYGVDEFDNKSEYEWNAKIEVQ